MCYTVRTVVHTLFIMIESEIIPCFISEFVIVGLVEYLRIVESWRMLYKELFGICFKLSNQNIPSCWICFCDLNFADLLMSEISSHRKKRVEIDAPAYGQVTLNICPLDPIKFNFKNFFSRFDMQ